MWPEHQNVQIIGGFRSNAIWPECQNIQILWGFRSNAIWPECQNVQIIRWNRSNAITLDIKISKSLDKLEGQKLNRSQTEVMFNYNSHKNEKNSGKSSSIKYFRTDDKIREGYLKSKKNKNNIL